MKKLLFFIIPFLFVLNVKALDVDVTDTITSPNSSTQGRYSATEIYNTGTDNIYNVKTRYNGKLSRIRFNLPLPSSLGQCFSTNVSYKVTLNMATSDWRNKFGSVTASAYNHNFALGGVPTFVSMKKIYFNVKLPTSVDYCVDYLFVDIQSTNVSVTAFTGESNWQLQSVILTDPTYDSGGSGGGSSPTPTPSIDLSPIVDSQNKNTEDIISNNNDNTNTIIENNNQNTNTIINNNDSNTDKIINSSCGLKTINPKPRFNGYICNSNGGVCVNTGYFITDFINITGGNSYTIDFKDISGMGYGHICWYNNDDVVSCSQYNSLSNFTTNMTFTAPVESNRLTFTYKKGSGATINGYLCTNSTDELVGGLTDVGQKVIDTSKQLVDSQNVCTNVNSSSIVKNGYALNNVGTEFSISGQGVTDYYSIDSNTFIYKINNSPSDGYYRLCFYNSSKQFVSCLTHQEYDVFDSLTIPTNASYVRFSINSSSNIPRFRICKNGNQAVSDSINNLTDTMKDDNIDDNSSFFSGFETETHGLSSIVTIPLSTIQQLTNSSCVALSVPIPYTNSNVSLPCMTQVYQEHIPTIFNLWQVVSFGIISYFICIDIYKMVKGFKDPQEDKIEVLDL